MTAKPLIFRELALRDIEEITAYYIDEAGEDIALRFADALQTASDIVAHRPAMGSPRLAHDLGIAGLYSRRLKRFPYLILYIDQDTGIEIVRILHAARDIPASISAA